MQDASDVMQLLLKTQTDFNDMEDDDPQVSSAVGCVPVRCWLVFVLPAWMCVRLECVYLLVVVSNHVMNPGPQESKCPVSSPDVNFKMVTAF